MGILECMGRGFKSFFFNEQAIIDNSNDSSATLSGLISLGLIGFISALFFLMFALFLSAFLGPGIAALGMLSLIIFPIVTIVFFMINYSIFNFVAKFVFRGEGTGVQYFRALSNALVVVSLFSIFNSIPFLGLILGVIGFIWIIVLNTYIIHKVHKLSVIKSILVLPVACILIIIIMIPIFLLFGS